MRLRTVIRERGAQSFEATAQEIQAMGRRALLRYLDDCTDLVDSIDLPKVGCLGQTDRDRLASVEPPGGEIAASVSTS